MLIFQADLKDLEVCAELFDEYRQFYGKESNYTAAKDFIQQRLTNKESILLLLYMDNLPAGFLQIYPSFSSLSLTKIWILNDLLVRPDFRQNGAAKALINKAVELAQINQIKLISLETTADNIAAQKLYRSMNFIPDQSFEHYQLKLG